MWCFVSDGYHLSYIENIWIRVMEQKSINFSKFGSTLVTGGAGFIGSHLVENLLSKKVNVKVLDHISADRQSNLTRWKDNRNFSFIQHDLGNRVGLQIPLKDIQTIFHLAADPDVRSGFETPETSYRENIRNTFHLLEAARKSNVTNFFFT